MKPCFPRDLHPRCIVDYELNDGDRGIYNPYLFDVVELVQKLRGQGIENFLDDLREYRASYVMKYAFAIPTWDIISVLAGYSPILEIGAGSGYWAMVLSAAGADVVALDRSPVSSAEMWVPGSGNAWFEEDWYYVEEGDASEAGCCPERCLFLCWPPLDDPMAETALDRYLGAGGRTVAYIGNPSSSGTPAFHERLASVPVERREPLWSWPGVEEALLVHRFR